MLAFFFHQTHQTDQTKASKTAKSAAYFISGKIPFGFIYIEQNFFV
jgi:hypothetical protein